MFNGLASWLLRVPVEVDMVGILRLIAGTGLVLLFVLGFTGAGPTGIMVAWWHHRDVIFHRRKTQEPRLSMTLPVVR